METNKEVRYYVAKFQQAEQEQDDLARDKYFKKLLSMYNDLIYFIVDKFPIPPRVGYDDVVQVAKVGMWKGFMRFDPEISKATTYLTRVIRGEILRYYRDFCWQWKVPRKLKEAVSGSHDKDLDALALKHNLTKDEIVEIQNILHSTTSHEDYIDYSKGKDTFMDEFDIDSLTNHMLSSLDEIEKSVVSEHYLEGRGLVDIADILCMEPTAVKKTLEKALEKLRTKYDGEDREEK
jgi:RNA polymerase sigma factor (sigma-70 family)